MRTETLPGVAELVVNGGFAAGVLVLFIVALALGWLLTRGQHRSIVELLREQNTDLRAASAVKDITIAELTRALNTSIGSSASVLTGAPGIPEDTQTGAS